MYDGFEKIEINISLEKALLLNSIHNLESNHLTIKILTHNKIMVQFTFFNVLAFRQIGKSLLIDFGKNKKNHPFLKEILEKKYGQIPSLFDERIFQFLDINGQHYLEIICSTLKYNIMD